MASPGKRSCAPGRHFCWLDQLAGAALAVPMAQHEPIALPKLDALTAFGQLLAELLGEAYRGLVIGPAKHPRIDEVAGRT